jgi:hypothetical protein
VDDEIVTDLREFFAAATAGNALGPDDDYDLDNFRTMNRIAGFVRRKRAAHRP